MDDARARDVLLRGMLSAVRDGHDSQWCKKKLVKPLRRLLAPPANVLHIAPEMERARAEAEASLNKFCRMCALPDCRGRGKEGD
jgi:hypothetical protein